MRRFLLFLGIIAVVAAKSVTFLKRAELTENLINNPRYLLWENDEGLFEVVDLESTENRNTTLRATEDVVSFHFYTPENPLSGVEIKESQLKQIVSLTGFNIARPTLVVIHGWKNHFESPVNDHIKNSALASHNINVIVVDWSRISRRNYLTAKRSVVAVGNYIGDFLMQLDDVLNHRLRKITIVGHSLGAHICGNAGARTKGLIETIIGLDPAGPLFSEKNINERLDPTDGKYVHVIHTNDGLLGFGIRMGHVDYYPNGGRSQPGCGIDIAGTCAHSRAYEYFAESLELGNFKSWKCDSYRDFGRNRCTGNAVSNMGGYPIERSTHGNYYLATNNRSPFARN